MREVVVTGLGIVSPLGTGKEAFLAGLRAGRLGLGPIRQLDVAGFRAAAGGEIPHEALPDLADDAKVGRCLALALRAAREALEDAHLAPHSFESRRAALALGTGAGEMRVIEEMLGAKERELPVDADDPLQPACSITSKLASRLGFRGRRLTFVNACSAGANAVAAVADLIRCGRIDVALAGGVEILSRMALSGFEALHAVSPTVCRPFDAQRNGIQLSELAAFLVLEGREHAASRGKHVYAELAGWGLSSDAFHPTRPDARGEGAALAIRRALKDAGLGPEEIDYVNAHGTATAANDQAELAAITAVFGRRTPSLPISSTKSMLGHALGASGAAELVATVLALHEGFLPPTINWEQPPPGYEGYDFVPNQARDGVSIRHAISNSFAFGGSNVVLVLSAAEG